MTSTIDLDTAAVLAAARADRAEADAAESRLLQRALTWSQLHQVVDPENTTIATYGDSPVSLAGQGAPHVSHFAVLEFGAVLRMSRRSVETLFAEVIELGHRLPLTWSHVTAGTLRAWRARQIAHATQSLSPEAAAFVDARVAPVADRIGPAELQRLIDAAIAQFMPVHAEQIAAAAEETQDVEILYDQPSYTGTCRILGELDLADAQDLEQAIQAGADQQKQLGSELPLGARRAKALGNLARGEIVFDYSSGLPDPDKSSTEPIKPPTVAPRQVMLYVHLNADDTAVVENAGRHLVTVDQAREWCRTAGNVTVRPVIDLAQEITTPGYRPSERLNEQVTLRDRWCPFPFCERNARHCDKDHIERYDPNGPPGQTTSSNLGPPCRTHHRVKTFSTWTYTRVGPDAYLWRSPHGYVFLKDKTGTRDLTPRPVEPPGSSRSP
ncbi:HNH endonuclease signature motif containing protein [Nocardioides marmorisolisilvae]|uniref:HNH endonuclease n=1 Tax=Nocardioides marmorisolisilvae TaxID=1542737 RepID=A0A3N0DSG5_9ACTN|nr:HNH endonuclease signature motif containing protein [Nocardioides marmorisolisilvae]RNL78577.1 HNH endonuclease [Nocardioides marmorisolisilvae]